MLLDVSLILNCHLDAYFYVLSAGIDVNILC